MLQIAGVFSCFIGFGEATCAALVLLWCLKGMHRYVVVDCGPLQRLLKLVLCAAVEL